MGLNIFTSWVSASQEIVAEADALSRRYLLCVYGGLRCSRSNPSWTAMPSLYVTYRAVLPRAPDATLAFMHIVRLGRQDALRGKRMVGNLSQGTSTPREALVAANLVLQTSRLDRHAARCAPDRGDVGDMVGSQCLANWAEQANLETWIAVSHRSNRMQKQAEELDRLGLAFRRGVTFDAPPMAPSKAHGCSRSPLAGDQLLFK